MCDYRRRIVDARCEYEFTYLNMYFVRNTVEMAMEISLFIVRTFIP